MVGKDVSFELKIGISKGNIPLEEGEQAGSWQKNAAFHQYDYWKTEYFTDVTKKGLQPCKCYVYRIMWRITLYQSYGIHLEVLERLQKRR